MTTLKLYGCPNSRSLRATWALEETGVEYEYRLVDLFKGAGRDPAFLALNAAGKIPVLIDGALTLTESAAIIAYLGDKFPASGLIPRDITLRADCMRWLFFAVTELEQPLWTIAKHRFALPKDKRVAGIEATSRWEFSVAAKLLEQALHGREFICGDTFTGADIVLAHTLSWARSAKVDLESAPLEGYLARLQTRPALARARAREAGASTTT
jgi:glutathione S-transferase